MIGDVRLTNKVLGTVRDTSFYVVQCVALVNVMKRVFSFLPGVCVFSHRYVAVSRIQPGTVFTSTVYVVSVLRLPRTCRGFGLCFEHRFML